MRKEINFQYDVIDIRAYQQIKLLFSFYSIYISNRKYLMTLNSSPILPCYGDQVTISIGMFLAGTQKVEQKNTNNKWKDVEDQF